MQLLAGGKNCGGGLWYIYSTVERPSDSRVTYLYYFLPLIFYSTTSVAISSLSMIGRSIMDKAKMGVRDGEEREREDCLLS